LTHFQNIVTAFCLGQNIRCNSLNDFRMCGGNCRIRRYSQNFVEMKFCWNEISCKFCSYLLISKCWIVAPVEELHRLNYNVNNLVHIPYFLSQYLDHCCSLEYRRPFHSDEFHIWESIIWIRTAVMKLVLTSLTSILILELNLLINLLFQKM
jgi:hypothetical protein